MVTAPFLAIVALFLAAAVVPDRVRHDVKGDDGKVENWKFESNPPRWFTKVGVTRADFAEAIGQTVTVEAVRAIDGSKYGYLQKITYANGNSIALGNDSEKEDGKP